MLQIFGGVPLGKLALQEGEFNRTGRPTPLEIFKFATGKLAGFTWMNETFMEWL